MKTGRLHEFEKINAIVGRKKIKFGAGLRMTNNSSNTDIETTVFYWETLKNSNETANLEIGSYCSIALNCKFFLGGNHDYERVSTWLHMDVIEDSIKSNGDIIVGHDVWIGFGATIMSGVTIGDGAVIAANANIVKDVEPYAIVGGNPAKLIKKRFSDEDIAFLLEIKWWEWPYSKIEEHKKVLFSDKFDRTKLQNLL